MHFKVGIIGLYKMKRDGGKRMREKENPTIPELAY